MNGTVCLGTSSVKTFKNKLRETREDRGYQSLVRQVTNLIPNPNPNPNPNDNGNQAKLLSHQLPRRTGDLLD